MLGGKNLLVDQGIHKPQCHGRHGQVVELSLVRSFLLLPIIAIIYDIDINIDFYSF
jgi:hypothetical protein